MALPGVRGQEVRAAGVLAERSIASAEAELGSSPAAVQSERCVRARAEKSDSGVCFASG